MSERMVQNADWLQSSDNVLMRALTLDNDSIVLKSRWVTILRATSSLRMLPRILLGNVVGGRGVRTIVRAEAFISTSS